MLVVCVIGDVHFVSAVCGLQRKYRINQNWLPYIDLRWLDRNATTYHREQNQIRLGVKYFF
ncbi:TPA: hypothetical protein RUS85_004798 [Citrobacter amalonaticus]|nr:hypothetical protein [Citrobacter amalonaticus]